MQNCALHQKTSGKKGTENLYRSRIEFPLAYLRLKCYIFLSFSHQKQGGDIFVGHGSFYTGEIEDVWNCTLTG